MIGAIPIIAENRIREAMEQGEFNHLEGAGKPFGDADGHYDPDWWLKRKLQREQVASLVENSK
jgi:predicted transcriptional regulator